MDKTIKACIFDMDGVLVDNRAYHKQAWSRYIEKHCSGSNFDYEQLMHQFFGKTNQKIFEHIYQRTITTEELLRLESEKEALYRDLYSSAIKPLPGLVGFLEELKQHKIPIGIGTSGPMENVLFVTEKTGVAEYFSAVTDANQVENGKPDPEVFLKTADKLKVKPENCVVFEDSISGIEAGIRAGMTVIGICTEHNQQTLLKAGAHKAFADFSAITIRSLICS